jgi:uncharacterized protein YqfA (UPF0365 family)
MIQTQASVFDGIADANIYDRGRFAEPNFNGVVRITKTIYKQTRAKGTAFIVELEVEESNLEAHPVGSKMSWYQSMNDMDVALSAVLEWVAACLGMEKHQKAEIKELQTKKNAATGRLVLAELLDEAVNKPDTNDFVGTKLRLSTILRKTKKDTDFTVYNFTPYSEAA